MDINEVRRRFVEEIRLRAYDDRFVSKPEEKEILQIAVGLGVSLDSAREALAYVCDQEKYTLESGFEAKAKELLNQFAAKDGKVDYKEFENAVGILKSIAHGMNDTQIQKRAKEVMVALSIPPKGTLFGGKSWFESIG